MPWRYRHRQLDGAYCRECGEPITLVSRPRFTDRLRHFLVHGMPAPEAWTCPNSHETDRSSWTALTFRKSRAAGVVRTAADVARAVHRERMVEPVPLTYLLAAGAGLGLGIVLDVLLGWSWWVVAAGFLAAVWLFFLSSALWHGNHRRLGRRLRSSLDPDGQHRREANELGDRVGTGAIPAYGVAGWGGPMALGGWTAADDEISSITLFHHTDPNDDAPTVVVTFHSGSRYFHRALADEVLEDFIVNSVAVPDADDENPGQRMARRRWQALHEPPPPWQDVVLEIDGAHRSFSALIRTGAWVGIASLSGGYLVVEGHGLEPGSFAMERKSDIAAYVAGTLERIGSRRP